MISHMKQVKADFLRKIREYMDSLEFPLAGKRICVCLSGGADSVALLHGMLCLSQEYNYTVLACHFNHLIRGDEADRDENFCKELCKSLGVKIYCGRDDVPAYAKLNKLSLEEAARKCRYAFFERMCKRNNIDYYATAHNMNDDAETLLLNLIRGSGSNGASSISPVSHNLLRPLLKISRSEIESFLSVLGQEFVTDSTNASDEYTRNYIRHVLIPDIEKINPSAVQALAKYTSSCRVDRDYFESEISQYLDSDLCTVHKALRDRVILRKYKDFSGNILNSNMLREIEMALLSGKRTVIPLNGDFEAIIQNGKVNFFNKLDNTPFEFEECVLKENDNSYFGGRVDIGFYNNFVNCENFNKISISDLLSFDSIKGVLRVRNRRTGDKIRIHGINKSLKKLFIENKIPKEYRDIIPIFLDDEGIIYVPFIGVSDRAVPINALDKRQICTVFNTVDKERWNNAYEK